MIKTFKAFTREIDDTGKAADEILSGLDPERNLLKNSVGLVSCFADFVGAGLISVLAAKLPFPIAGMTTIASSADGVSGESVLILTVLTSDDVEFVTGLTVPITDENDEPFREAWRQATKGRSGKPSLMLSFAPLLLNVSADFFAEAWSNITGNVPNFGSLAVDHNLDYHEAQTILNGKAYRDQYVFVLCYGSVKPEFFVAGISEEKAFREKAVITAATGMQLKTVNNMPVTDYLSGLGLTKDEAGHIVGINAYPFLLDYNDGSQPVVRCMFALTPDGSAVCGGEMPVGATLTVGKIDADEVLSTTDKVLRQALALNKHSGMLIFSCVGRFFAQGYDSAKEMEKTRDLLAGRAPWHLAYSGGEICPVPGVGGKLINRSHNDTFIVCMF
jgi:hypothetical protein